MRCSPPCRTSPTHFVEEGPLSARGVEDGKEVLVDRGFDRSWVAKSMVVLTDGIHNSGVDPLDVVGAAVQERITVHTITFSDEADQTHMQSLASQGNGNHWHAPHGQ